MNTTSENPAADTPAPRQRGRVALKALIGLSLGLAAAGYGWHWWTAGRFTETTDDAYVGGDITVISAKIPGYIRKVLVRDNQFVHAGDVLVLLDDRDYKAALAKAEGNVAAQQALIGNLDATRTLQQAVIAQAQASVAAAVAERVRATDDARRYASLVGSRAVSAQLSQQAATDSDQARANEQKARAALTAAEQELAVIATRRLQAEAALDQARADRDLAALNLGYTELRAPVDGFVGNRRAQDGAFAQASSQLLSLVPAQGLWVDANFKESQLAQVRPGYPATIEVDALPGHRFQGHVVSLAPATGAQFSILPAENATGNFTKIVQRVPVRIALDDRNEGIKLLRAGLSVVAEVHAR